MNDYSKNTLTIQISSQTLEVLSYFFDFNRRNPFKMTRIVDAS